jgi:hypothetical protein
LKGNQVRFKKIFLSVVFSGLFVAGNVQATIVTDIGNTLQNVLNNLQDVETRISTEVERQAERLLEKELSALGIESDAAQAAQELTANQRLEENLRNQEVARQQAPLVDVCQDSAIFSITFDGDINCYRDEATQDFLSGLNVRQNEVYNLSGSELGEAMAEDSEETVMSCLNYLHSQGSDVEFVDPAYSYCFDSSALVDSNVTTLQSGLEEQGAEMAVKLLTEPTLRPKSLGSDNTNTAEGRKELLNERRKDMLIKLAQSVMAHNVEVRRSSKWIDAEKTQPLPSLMETLDSFNNNRLLSEGGEYLLKLGAAHADKFDEDSDVAIESTFTIEQVQRETAVMTAFLSHMAVLQYKSQLRIEQIEAALLSVQVNPPE